jgi:hypothetical protein
MEIAGNSKGIISFQRQEKTARCAKNATDAPPGRDNFPVRKIVTRGT